MNTQSAVSLKGIRLAKETYILLVICLLDLLITIWLIMSERAIEGNPVMSFYLGKGWAPFIGIKIMLVVLPLSIAEWARRYHPVSVRRMLQAAILIYLGIYSIAFMQMDMKFISKRAYLRPPVVGQYYPPTALLPREKPLPSLKIGNDPRD